MEENRQIKKQKILNPYGGDCEERIRRMRMLIPEGTAHILDFSPDETFLSALLSSAICYNSVKWKEQEKDSNSCCLELEQFENPVNVVAFCSGILEFIQDLDLFVEQLSHHVDTVILSYSACEYVPEKEDRVAHGWVNDLTTAQLLDIFAKHGFYVSEWDRSIPTCLLWRMRKIQPERLSDNYFCSGCGACANICPTGALSMGTDTYGYYVPLLDKKKCICCRQCIEKCPTIHVQDRNTAQPTCYAVAMNDLDRVGSSSGGIFPALSRWVLQNKGVVCGAAWTEKFGVRHIVIDQMEDLSKLCHSKYLQSNMGMVYREIESYVKQGRLTLFSACPCQIAGLYAYLGQEYDNLYTIDLLCADSPSTKFFQKYLKETFGEDEVESYTFRDKTLGWPTYTIHVILKNGKELVRTIEDDLYQQAFHPRLMMPSHCEECRYCGFPRQGDITIGDFHGIFRYDDTLDDKKGLSVLLVNNDKGVQLRHVLERRDQHATVIVETPLNWVIEENRVQRKGFDAHICRDTFYDLIRDHSFRDAVLSSLQWKRDVGILGCWSERNYGSELTYVALHNVVRMLGYSALLFERPMDAQWHGSGNLELFRRDPLLPGDVAAPFPSKRDMRVLNDRCKAFIVGSDQMWPHYNNIAFGEVSYLDFIHSDKQIIAYATSYGGDSWLGDELYREENSYYLSRFDAVSTREKSGADLSEAQFGVKAEWTLDPVFICDQSIYRRLADQSAFGHGKYVGAYILDVTPEKEKALHYISDKLGLPVEIITDAKNPRYDSWSMQVNRDIYVEDWLKMFQNCEYMVTDSFHGMCLALVFNKPFVAIVNRERGASRFMEYGRRLGILDCIVQSPEQIWTNTQNLPKPDYDQINRELERWKVDSLNWLKKALAIKKEYRGMSGFDVAAKRIEQMQVQTERMIQAVKEENRKDCLSIDHKIEATSHALEKIEARQAEMLTTVLKELREQQEKSVAEIRDLLGEVKKQQEKSVIETMNWVREVRKQQQKIEEQIQYVEERGRTELYHCLRIQAQDMSNRVDMIEETIQHMVKR